jgi:hypothetical protein
MTSLTGASTIHAEHLLDGQVPPQMLQFRDGLRERAGRRRQLRNVHRAGRYAGQDRDLDVGIVPCDPAQHADLVRAACTAARQHQTAISPLITFYGRFAHRSSSPARPRMTAAPPPG